MKISLNIPYGAGYMNETKVESTIGMKQDILLETQDLKKYFYQRQNLTLGHRSVIKAVNGINLDIKGGETLGLVGESGCGKSTLGRILAGLDQETYGTFYFAGKTIQDWRKNNLPGYRRQVQLVFQDPFASLNPRRTAGRTIEEPFIIHTRNSKRQRAEEVSHLMEVVGLAPEHMHRYPHEFSGGQRQRIGIARALALKPQLVIADEPVSALDVSIQAQILNLLKDLQHNFGLTYLFITHNLSVVRHISDRIAVMYLGKIVDLAPNEDFFQRLIHPYTRALLSALPLPEPGRTKKRIILTGDMPNPLNIPPGCSFHPRCPFRLEICDKKEPALRDRGKGHFSACHLEH